MSGPDLDCACRDFCDVHGRQFVCRDGAEEWCGECAADGFTGELCKPCPDSCHSGRALEAMAKNQWERQFMCSYHQLMHRLFCGMESSA